MEQTLVFTKDKEQNGRVYGEIPGLSGSGKLIAPIELRTNGSAGGEHENYGTSGRNTFALSLSYSQIINQNFQVEFWQMVFSRQDI
jgi:hypothetical protein